MYATLVTSLSSETIRDEATNVAYMPGTPEIFVPAPGGDVLVRPVMLLLASTFDLRPGVVSGGPHAPHLRTDSTGVVLGTVAWLEDSSTTVNVMIGETLFRINSPFEDWPLSAPFPDGSGLVVVERSTFDGRGDATFRIVGIALDGDTLFAGVRAPSGSCAGGFGRR